MQSLPLALPPMLLQMWTTPCGRWAPWFLLVHWVHPIPIATFQAGANSAGQLPIPGVPNLPLFQLFQLFQLCSRRWVFSEGPRSQRSQRSPGRRRQSDQVLWLRRLRISAIKCWAAGRDGLRTKGHSNSCSNFWNRNLQLRHLRHLRQRHLKWFSRNVTRKSLRSCGIAQRVREWFKVQTIGSAWIEIKKASFFLTAALGPQMNFKERAWSSPLQSNQETSAGLSVVRWTLAKWRTWKNWKNWKMCRAQFNLWAKEAYRFDHLGQPKNVDQRGHAFWRFWSVESSWISWKDMALKQRLDQSLSYQLGFLGRMFRMLQRLSWTFGKGRSNTNCPILFSLPSNLLKKLFGFSWWQNKVPQRRSLHANMPSNHHLVLPRWCQLYCWICWCLVTKTRDS